MGEIRRHRAASAKQSEAKVPPGAEEPVRRREAPFGLSERELVVLRLLTEGLTDKQIAMALGVTSHTINKHVGAILAKMDRRSRTAAAVTAIRMHLFDSDGEAPRWRAHRRRSRGRSHGPRV